jgi:hypothetical protein
MSHLTEDDLVLHHYGEHGEAAAVAAHLERCEACRASMEALRTDLASVTLDVPAASADYATRVWERLRPQLGAGSPRRGMLHRPAVRRAAGYLALAASLVAAFILGRMSPQPSRVAMVPDTRERVLLAAVARHLDRSQRVLVELAHADEGNAGDLSARAERLVAENRLYRQSARQAGEVGLASLLDELGLVLLEVAHAPEPLAPGDVRDLNARVERKALLFKVRVVGSRLVERERVAYGTQLKSSL